MTCIRDIWPMVGSSGLRHDGPMATAGRTPRSGPGVWPSRQSSDRPPAPPTWPRSSRKWSRRQQASIASPTGTARMPTQGSCRPLVTISVSSPVTVIVRRGVRIEEVGLTAKRTTTSWPEEMPPRMPPAWFEEKRGAVVAHEDLVGVLRAGQRRRSEAGADLDALDRVDRHHQPGEVAVELGVDRRAEAGRDAVGDELDHGADRVAGLAQRRRDSPPSRRRPRGRGTRRGSAAPRPSPRRRGRSVRSPICTRAPRMRIFGGSAARTARATPPAATRAAVSRADERPPPR